MEIAGIKSHLTDGVSLLHGNYPEFAYSETYFAQLVEANKHCYEMNQKYEWGWTGVDSLVSIRSNQWKLICTANGEIRSYMLFDLANDSEENINLIHEDRCQGVVQRLHKEIRTMIGDDRQFEIVGKTVDGDVAEKLKSLGYL